MLLSASSCQFSLIVGYKLIQDRVGVLRTAATAENDVGPVAIDVRLRGGRNLLACCRRRSRVTRVFARNRMAAAASPPPPRTTTRTFRRFIARPSVSLFSPTPSLLRLVSVPPTAVDHCHNNNNIRRRRRRPSPLPNGAATKPRVCTVRRARSSKQ